MGRDDPNRDVRRLPLFATLPDEVVSEMASLASERTAERGEILFCEGEAAATLPGLLEGQVKLVRSGPDGREQLLHLVRAPATFAEAAVFGPGVYPATAEVVQRARLLSIPREALLDLLRRRPEIALALLTSLSLWLRRLADLVEGLSLRTVEERVAAYLWAAFVRTRQPLTAGTRVRLEDPKHLIAGLCGTAPEVLSRTFRRLEEEGAVRIEGPEATLLDPSVLHARARGDPA